MKLTRICFVSLGCMAGAFTFGVIANMALDLVMPAEATVASDAAVTAPVLAKGVEPAPVQQASFALASAESTPVQLGPSRVKTVPIVMRDGAFADAAREPIATTEQAAAAPCRRAVS